MDTMRRILLRGGQSAIDCIAVEAPEAIDRGKAGGAEFVEVPRERQSTGGDAGGTKHARRYQRSGKVWATGLLPGVSSGNKSGADGGLRHGKNARGPSLLDGPLPGRARPIGGTWPGYPGAV